MGLGELGVNQSAWGVCWGWRSTLDAGVEAVAWGEGRSLDARTMYRLSSADGVWQKLI